MNFYKLIKFLQKTLTINSSRNFDIITLNKRTIDFHQLSEKIEAIRLTKEQYTYHSYLLEFAGKNCALCVLPLNPFGIYLKHEEAICIHCFNAYITTEDYLFNLESFEAKVLKTNELASIFSISLKTNPRHIDLNLANQLFKGLSVSEVEQLIGLPKHFGSLDHGDEVGNWKLGNIFIEIWFNSQICTRVD